MDRTCFRHASATLDDENRQSPLPAWTTSKLGLQSRGGSLTRLFPRFAGGHWRGGGVHQSAPGLSASSAVRDAHLATSWQARGTMRPGEGGRGLKHHDALDHAAR